ncbi:NADP-dependent oxidoreductase [Nocardiopsis rhodophaea]|uniref:NADP-dependent oxidoreductase n=1 Tax=Nocardiopsis rhodophaea TaxID=280238 RepID=A0ABN2S638_9ACTN
MRAVMISQYGDPDVLETGEVPVPETGPGQILVRTTGSAVNPVDLEIRSGSARDNVSVPFPMVLGWDLSGEVAAIGAGVDEFAPGDRVIAMSAQMATGVGTHAEYVALPAAIAAHAPRTVALEKAAALPLAGLTALQALEQLDARPGQSLVVSGAVGSVGGYAVQLAVSRGLDVTAHVRERDRGAAEGLGARRVVSGATPGLDADLLLDTAGIPAAVAHVRDGGRAVSIVPTRPPVTERGISVAMSFVEQDGAGLSTLSTLVDKGALTLRVGGRYGFDEATSAHRRLAAGGSRGKLLILP